MSVRRLAEEQPESFAFSKASEEKVAFWMNKYPEDRKASAVIPLLWLAQKQEGWVSEPAIRDIANRLGMPYIRVYEVATFYTMFNLEPVGEHLIQVCGTTPCWLRGADDLKAVCETRIGKKGRGNVTADGKFSWEEVECLGACANAPMVQISNADGDYYYEDLTAKDLEAILDDLAAGKSVEQGPVTGRKSSEPTMARQKVLAEESLFDGSRAKPLSALPSGKGKAEEPAAKTKKVSDERHETEEKRGKAIAKPAPKDKAEATKPAGKPKATKKADPDKPDSPVVKKKATPKKAAPKKPGKKDE